MNFVRGESRLMDRGERRFEMKRVNFWRLRPDLSRFAEQRECSNYDRVRCNAPDEEKRDGILQKGDRDNAKKTRAVCDGCGADDGRDERAR